MNSRIHEHLNAYPTPSDISLHKHDKYPKNFNVIISTNNHKILESIIINEHDSSKLLNRKEASVPVLLNL